MSTVTEILGNIDKNIQDTLDQKHKCESLYNDIMLKKKELEKLAEVYKKEVDKYHQLLIK